MTHEPVRDFVPVLNIVQSITVMVAGPRMRAGNLQEFIAVVSQLS